MERNSAYHGVDDDKARIKQSDDLNDLIVQSYQLDCYHVAMAHTPLFKLPMTSTLNQNDDAKQSWLHNCFGVFGVLTGVRAKWHKLQSSALA
jgi:hypothetical protein